MTEEQRQERAEIALKVAEANLESVTTLVNLPENRPGLTFDLLVSLAEARIKLAHGWLELWEVSG